MTVTYCRDLHKSIAGRLLTGYAVFILLLATTWGVGALATQQMTVHVTNAVESNDALLSLVMDRVKLMDDQETGLRGYLLTRHHDFLAPYLQAQQSLAGVRIDTNALSGTEPRIRVLLTVMSRRASAWEAWARAVLTRSSATTDSPGAISAQRQGKHLFDRYRATAETVMAVITAERDRNLQQSRHIPFLMNLLSGGIFALAVLLTLLIARLTIRAVTRPLAQLGTAAESIGEGDLSTAVPVSGDIEFRRLAAQMDRMRGQLAEHAGAQERVEETLRAQARRLSLIIETQLAIARAELDLEQVLGLITDRAQTLTDAAGSVVELAEGDELVYRATSGAAEAHRGLRVKLDSSLSGLCLQTGEILQCVDSETDPRVDRAATRRIGARSMLVVPLHHIDRTVGVLKVFSPQASAFSALDVETLRLIASQIAAALVISSQFEAKQILLSERDNALTEFQHANDELKSFAYSVSHDLRAPLRSLDGFSEILLQDYAGHLDSRATRYLNHIRNAAQEMGHLIDALLQLSRTSQMEVQRECVDLTAMARAVVDGLRSNEPERRISVSIADGMTAQGDPRLLRAVLDNLVGNAWKFTRKRDNACIEMSVEGHDGTPVYVVRDNGAGFNMNYAAKLFAPFQRLHGPREFEGTGIGLATVQRIIRRHGGRVWAESAVGQGATFYFTLTPEEAA